jgi:hypothetical protein
MRCTYCDEMGADHDALVVQENEDGSRDLVILKDGTVVVVQHVPSRSSLISDQIFPEVYNKAGAQVQPELRLPKRALGAFWRD